MVKDAKVEEQNFINDFVSNTDGAQGAQGAQGDNTKVTQDDTQEAQGVQDDSAQGAQSDGTQGAQGVQDDSAQGAQSDGAQGAQSSIDYEALYKQEVHRTKSWEGRLSAEAKRNKEIQAKLDEITKKATQDTSVSLEDVIKNDPELKAFVDEMGEDFTKPIIKMLTIMARKMINDAIQPIQDSVNPIKEKIVADDEALAKKHYQSILNAHGDALKLLETGELNKWIETLPYKQAVDKQRILQEGETTEVIALLTEYKEFKSPSKGAQSVPENKNNGHKHTPGIDAATVVKTGPVSLPKGLTKAQDFVGAFEEATQQA